MELIKTYLGWIIFVVFVLMIFFYKKISNNKDAITSKFTAKQILPLNINSSIILVKQAMQNAKFNNIGLDLDENRLYAESGFSMSSWSELIQVKANKIEGNTEIEFKSICAFPMQIYDWGKNRRNYRRFEKELSKLANSNNF